MGADFQAVNLAHNYGVPRRLVVTFQDFDRLTQTVVFRFCIHVHILHSYSSAADEKNLSENPNCWINTFGPK